jgi:2-dehydro-3-deoxygluconokinase
MSIDLRKDCRYALVVPTSMGVRLTPPSGQPFHCSDTLFMQATSAETNVASVPAYLGLKVKVLTTFVKDSPIARFIKDDLAGRHIEYEGREVEQGGPWGYRHQFNIADSGFGSRGPRVHNDRAGEVGRTLNVKDFDLDRIFGRDGVRWFHTGGIFAALSETTPLVARESMQAAKRHGVVVSYDLNYRESLWKSIGGKKRAQEVNRELAAYVDVMLGNEEDFTSALGFAVAGLDENLSELDPENFRSMIERVVTEFPDLKVVATTLRNATTATLNDWGAVCYDSGQMYHATTRKNLEIYDRVGGGDSFASGLIYGLLTGQTPQWAVDCGAAHGALAMTTPGDTSMATLDEVLRVMKGSGARIAR